MIHWGWLMLAIFLAASIGYFAAALCATAGRADEAMADMKAIDKLERMRKEGDKLWRP